MSNKNKNGSKDTAAEKAKQHTNHEGDQQKKVATPNGPGTIDDLSDNDDSKSAMHKDGTLTGAPVPTAATTTGALRRKFEPIGFEEALACKDINEGGKIQRIIALFKGGKTNKEIVELGYDNTTVSIQVTKYKKLHPDLYPPKVKEEKVKDKEVAATSEATA